MLSFAGHRRAVTLLLPLALLAGCATQESITQSTEQMLAASGFLQKPADTAARQARLAALPPYRLLAQRVMVHGVETVGYVYADPQYCHCVYVGDPAANQRFQELAFQARMNEEQMQAAEIANEDAFGWDDWGPYPFWGYGGGGVVVVRGGFRGGGMHGEHEGGMHEAGGFHGGGGAGGHFGGK